MKAYWYTDKNWTLAGNWGDIITPYILEYLTGEKSERVNEKTQGKLLSVGSNIEFLEDNDIVWGAGLIQPMQLVKKQNVRFCALRGKLTRDYLMKAGYENIPEVYCDPAVLMPIIYEEWRNKKVTYQYGIIPHYVDYQKAKQIFFEPFQIINIFSGITNVMDKVTECDTILSSSLHGLILAESMGKPAFIVRFTNNIIGDSFKYEDYYSGTLRKLPNGLDLRGRTDLSMKEFCEFDVRARREYKKPHFNLSGLMESCPFKYKLESVKY